ncbi:MAG: insulinase family protein [Eubacteriales bacterium]|nr:insulinase family protein [Eubacteriales bacterium]
MKHYRTEYECPLPDIGATGHVLTHEDTGATVVLVDTDDENKVFTIGFRTPPEDGTGVAHILEHSVLCGSERYPLKDPFVELVKGSLNTFLNAMTFPDKTIYPVASMNDKDFKNLMAVYLDAVFFPNIYKKPEIFKQEGWHYHLEKPDDPLTINGVVYNEMKGVYSLPDGVMEEKIMAALFRDTQYGVSSGGDPEEIPNLTYEAFTDFHRRYYHPSNAYIILYGRMDFEERLAYIHREYLSRFKHRAPDSALRLQAPADAPVRDSFPYSVAERETGENGGYYSYSTVIDNGDDLMLQMAMDAVSYALINASGSRVRKGLIDAGLASDVRADTETCVRQPFFTITAKEGRPGARDEFEETVNRLIREEIKRGLDQDALLAAVNQYEFRFKEADYGGAPKGLFYMMAIFDGLLYDKQAAFLHLNRGDIYDRLRAKIGTGYFEALTQTYILDNPAKAILAADPVPGLTAKRDAALAEQLAQTKASLSPEEIEVLVAETAKLKRFQTAPSTPEQLATLPKLARGDLGTAIQPLRNEMVEQSGLSVLHHDYPTNGLAYLHMDFAVDAATVDPSLLQCLTAVLGKVDTAHYSYADLSNAVYINTGGISVHVRVIEDVSSRVRMFLALSASCVADKVQETVGYMAEILQSSRFTDTARLNDLLREFRTKQTMSINAGGHVAAAARAASGGSAVARLKDALSGVAYLDCLNRYEDTAAVEQLADILTDLKHAIPARDRMLLHCTGTRADAEHFATAVASSFADLPTVGTPAADYTMTPHAVAEGIRTSSMIQFVARSGNFKRAGLPYTGRLKILESLLSYEYLWENIRVQGGAYGCMSSFARNGDAYLVSYRDPKLRETNAVYEALPEWLEKFEADEETMLKYIIGALSKTDQPLTARQAGLRSFSAWLQGLAEADLQQARDEILCCKAEDIRACAAYVRALLADGGFCVIGNENAVNEAADLFRERRNLS